MKHHLLSDLIDKAIIDLLSDKILALIGDINPAPKQMQSFVNPIKMTVIFTGELSDFYPIILDQLALLPNSYSIYLLFSQSAQQSIKNKKLVIHSPSSNIHVINQCHYDDKYIGSDFLLLPELSLNSLAKSSVNIADNIATEYIQYALMNGKKIIATFDYFYEKKNITMHYQQFIQHQIDKLINFNVNIITVSQISTVFECQGVKSDLTDKARVSIQEIVNSTSINSSKKSKNVISSTDIRRHNPKTPLYLFAESLVTPLAMDMIKQRNIRIIKE